MNAKTLRRQDAKEERSLRPGLLGLTGGVAMLLLSGLLGALTESFGGRTFMIAVGGLGGLLWVAVGLWEIKSSKRIL